MRAGIAQFWDGYAQAYDDEADHGLRDPDVRDAWRDLLRDALPPVPGVVVDLACGTGSLSVLAAELGHHVVGADASIAMLARARAKVSGHPRPSRMPCGWVRADVAVPPLAPGIAHAVLARHILWTLPDPLQALAEWSGLLRPGGRLVLVEGRWWSVGDESYQTQERQVRPMPWAGGVRAAELREAVCATLTADVTVTPLDDPRLWGREITDERYLLVAVAAPGGDGGPDGALPGIPGGPSIRHGHPAG